MEKIRLIVNRPDAGLSLKAFLARRLALSGRAAKDILDRRGVFVNRRRVWMAHHRLETGDTVEVLNAPAAPAPSPIPILHSDAYYVIADKPPALLSCGPDSAEVRLRTPARAPALRAVHRLDRDTSGCLLLAREEAAFEAAVSLFRDRNVRKTYEAIVAGRVLPPAQTIRAPLENRPASTRIRTVSATAEATHLAIEIETGLTHQIRKHLALIGHPVLGDRQYGTRIAVTDRTLDVPRQMLHARSIEFTHPFGGMRVRREAPLPGDFRKCLQRFGLRR